MNVFQESQDYYEQSIYFIKMFPSYERNNYKYDPFVYEFEADYLKRLKKQLNIEKADPAYGTVRHVLYLMNFVYEKLMFKEELKEKISNMHAAEILDIVQREKKGADCLTHATVMTEILLSHNYYARTVRCLPIGNFPYDVHNVTVVYVQEIGKWMMLDPTFNLFIVDSTGEYLSLPELKDHIIHDRKVEVCANHRFKNINVHFMQEQYLKYMVKNLFRFQSSIVVNQKEQDTEVVRIYELYPKDYLPYKEPLVVRNYLKRQIHYLSDDYFFWQLNGI